MWFLWWGTIRYLYGTSVRILFFRCTALYEALTDISHLAAVSQGGTLLTYSRTCVYSRVLYFHFLTSLLPVTYLSSFISFTLRFWSAFRLFLFSSLHTSDQPWGLPTMGPQSFPRVKRPGRGVTTHTI